MICHNVPVTVERDVRLTPSPKAAGATSEAIEPVSRQAAYSFSKVAPMTGTATADTTPALQVDAVTPAAKSKPQTLRELERGLKSLGLSQREAAAVAKGGFAALGLPEPEPDLSRLAALIAKNISLFESNI
jgi:hypothetical protein